MPNKSTRRGTIACHRSPAGRPYACPVESCGWRFRQRAFLYEHTRIHRGERPYVCPIESCDRRFVQLVSMQAHIQQAHTHDLTRVLPYACPLENCQRRFRQSAHQKTHLRVHAREKPHVCLFAGCRQRFSQKQGLQGHLRTDHAERPYAFPFEACANRLRTQSGARGQLVSHTKIKPFICPHEGCERSFSCQQSQQRHQSTHTREKPVVLSRAVCEERLSRQLNPRILLRGYRNSPRFSSLPAHGGTDVPDVRKTDGNSRSATAPSSLYALPDRGEPRLTDGQRTVRVYSYLFGNFEMRLTAACDLRAHALPGHTGHRLHLGSIAATGMQPAGAGNGLQQALAHHLQKTPPFPLARPGRQAHHNTNLVTHQAAQPPHPVSVPTGEKGRDPEKLRQGTRDARGTLYAHPITQSAGGKRLWQWPQSNRGKTPVPTWGKPPPLTTETTMEQWKTSRSATPANQSAHRSSFRYSDPSQNEGILKRPTKQANDRSSSRLTVDWERRLTTYYLDTGL